MMMMMMMLIKIILITGIYDADRRIELVILKGEKPPHLIPSFIL